VLFRSVMPTGGVEPTEPNLKSWFDAGVTCVGMGSNLFPSEVIKAGEWDKITTKVAETLAIINTLKK
ncbi:MAG: bifunctional 4-hydroxy-2-oxoglutarate aldolase/2-dehydro-3-deoxy-phosphogluconate aldolase, partial [Bacteroidales bacterium]